MKTRLIQQLQSYVAETCIGASALRNQGGSGLIQAARSYFKTIDLTAIPKTEDQFFSWLNLNTDALLDQFPSEARKFGTTRKALNLFVRSVAYNCRLNHAFHLDAVMPWLEVPLDSYVAKNLLKRNPSIATKWIGLKFVSASENAKYQSAASHLAKQWAVNRVDLDVFFYRDEVFAK